MVQIHKQKSQKSGDSFSINEDFIVIQSGSDVLQAGLKFTL